MFECVAGVDLRRKIGRRTGPLPRRCSLIRDLLEQDFWLAEASRFIAKLHNLLLPLHASGHVHLIRTNSTVRVVVGSLRAEHQRPFRLYQAPLTAPPL